MSFGDESSYQHLLIVTLAWTSGSAAADVALSASMCVLLYRTRAAPDRLKECVGYLRRLQADSPGATGSPIA